MPPTAIRVMMASCEGMGMSRRKALSFWDTTLQFSMQVA